MEDLEEKLEDSMKSYMRKRVFGLLLTNFLENLELKQITVDVGEETKLDLKRKEFEDAFRLNTLESISHILLNDIMPMIEKKPSFFSTRERSICEKEIRGTIDWPKTFIRNFSQGQIFGKEFVVVNPKQEWDTPENLLSMLCLLDIVKNTSYFKRMFKDSIETSRWTKRIMESSVLDALAQEGDRRTKVPYFKKIEEQVEELMEDPSRIEALEREFEKRLDLNLIRNPGYQRVMDWRKELTGTLDVQKESTRILRDLPGEGGTYMERIYELWTLFEIADVMEEQVHLFKYYSQAGTGPLFSGILPNPGRNDEPGENVDIEILYLPVEQVAREIWRRTYERRSFMDAFFPDAENHRAIVIRGLSSIEIAPGQRRRVSLSVGLFPRYQPVPGELHADIDIVAIPLHPSDDREVLNRKLLNNLTKYIRGLPFSSESKGIVIHPATWAPSSGQPGEVITAADAEAD
jgi:hypothetical protein